MRIRPLTDFTKGMVRFIWKKAEDVVLRVDKPTPVGKGVRGRKANQKALTITPKRKRKSYEVDI